MIPYGKQNISEEDIQEVVDVLRSDFLTQGSKVPAFEQAIANYCGANFGVAVNSATSALHIACLALGLGKNDILWTSPITFVASANCAVYCGASVDFVDIDPQTYNISTDALKCKLIEAQKLNKLPKVLIPVHLCGQSCNMEAIHKLSLEYGFKIIEDASHAIGGSYKNKHIGNCQYSDITVFSFHPVKIITSAEGGMALSNNMKLAEEMSLLRSHGITRDAQLMTEEAHGPWYYQQIDLGFNYRMTELQAALGLSQLKRLDLFIQKRQMLAKRYHNQLVDLPVTLPYQDKDTYSAYHLFPIRLKLNQIKKTHDQVFKELRENGIGVNLHYIPVHTQPYYKKMGFKEGDYPQAEAYYSEAISLPLFPDLTEDNIQFIVQKLTEILGE